MPRLKPVRESTFLKIYKSTALLEQKSTCFYCYEPLTRKTSTVEHVQAKSKGGLNRRENIVASCSHCNHTKGNKSEKEFKKLVQTSLDYQFLMIRFRKALWIQTHKSCTRIMRSVGGEYNSPIRY